MIGLGHWKVHRCDKRGERNDDDTVEILYVFRPPYEGWPNMGQFQFSLKDMAKQGFFINYCPYCNDDVRYYPYCECGHFIYEHDMDGTVVSERTVCDKCVCTMYKEVKWNG